MTQPILSLSRSQVAVFSFLLSVTLLNNFQGSIKWVGFAAILKILGFSLIFLLELQRKGTGVPRPLVSVAVWSVLLVGLYLLATITDGLSGRSLIVAGEVMTLLCFFFAVSLLRWRDGLVGSLGVAIVLPILLLSFSSDTSSANENTLGGFLAFLLFWPMAGYVIARRSAYRLLWAAVVLIGSIGVIFHGARSTWIALAGCGVTYLLLTWFRGSRTAYMGLFIVTMILVLAFPAIYTSLPQTSLGIELQELSRELTGSNLFSGRDRLWPLVIGAIQERPILGYGGSATPELITNTRLSSHNLYLQVALQTGLPGLAVLIGLLSSIWRVLWLGRRSKIGRLSSSFMIAMVLHQVFEVSLLQNNLAIGIAQWLVLGVGMSIAVNPKRSSELRS